MGYIIKVFCVILLVLGSVKARIGLKKPNTAFDNELYKQVLDPEACDQQIKYIRSDLLLNLEFVDAGIRLPRGLLSGNTVDLGNYHQCLGIDEMTDNFEIKGKYCMIRVPFNQTLNIPWVNDQELEVMHEKLQKLQSRDELQQFMNLLGDDIGARSSITETPLSRTILRVAVCIPRPCSVEQAMSSALMNLTEIGFEFEEDFCRLPDDKPWSPADYVAVSLFLFISLLTVMSTSYDFIYTFIQKRDPKKASALYRSFSLYTNGKRLTTFSVNPNNLQCLDGIKSLATLWVIVGHTFSSDNFYANIEDIFQWVLSGKSVWMTAAPYTVDTFLMITGLLLVWTTIGKFTGKSLLKNLHLFYLNRLLRLFPLLALTVLLQASLLNIMLDGPYWTHVAEQVHRCQEHWWTTLLHIQNFATPSTMCIAQSWYIAIDVQLHIVSPLVLFWVLNKSRKSAWIALTTALILVYASTTYYNTYKDFPGHHLVTSRPRGDYITNYYTNTFTRASPFFVGMVFGYLLSIYKGRKLRINILLVVLLWASAFTILGLIFYAVHEMIQVTWNDHFSDVIVNSYSRSAWAAALGWVVFACVHGYGGPINWFLTLDMWKLPGRLSYAMFLLHYPFMFAINSTALAPAYFSVYNYLFKSLAYTMFTFMAAFLACIFIDAPCTVLFKLMLGGSQERKQPSTGTTTKRINN